MAGDDDRGALLLADALNHVGDSHLGRWVKIVERLIQEKNFLKRKKNMLRKQAGCMRVQAE